jgi:hypothetical protein
MSLKPGSRAYDPSYSPSKPLEQLAAENPSVQFLQDRLAEQREALKENAAKQENLSPSIAARQLP